MRDPFFSPPTPLFHITKPLATAVGLTTLPRHVHEVAIAYSVYTFLFTVVSPSISSRFPSYRRLPKRSQVDWNVRVVSTIQSTFITACALYILSIDRRRSALNWYERIWGYDGASGMVQGLAAGYFLWDLQVSAVHLDVLGVGSLVHAISALLVTGIGFRPFVNYYGLNFILYEASTPFLNGHWFFDKLQMTGSSAQLYNGIVLIGTFFCARLAWGTYQSIRVYQDLWKAWTYAGSNATPLPFWLAVMFAGSNSALCVLNYYWFGKMVTAVRSRFTTPEKRSGDADQKLEQSADHAARITVLPPRSAGT